MGKQNLPHDCFTDQIFNEPCPKCGTTEAVFVGHGTTRHCSDCVLSWGADEVNLSIELAEPPIKKKIRQMPKGEKKAVNDLVKDLKKAGGIEARLKRLRGISDDEWKRAETSGG